MQRINSKPCLSLLTVCIKKCLKTNLYVNLMNVEMQGAQTRMLDLKNIKRKKV